MNKNIRIIGMAACVALVGCTSMGDTTQLHDTRQRMRHGDLTGQSAPTNYGVMARANQDGGDVLRADRVSAQSNTATTWNDQTIQNSTAGNGATVVMVNAPARNQPEATAGNTTPSPIRPSSRYIGSRSRTRY